MVLRLKNDAQEYKFALDCDVRDILPGDKLWKGYVTLPTDAVKGTYEASFAIASKDMARPVITMPIDGENNDGWTILGKVEIE